MSGPVPSIKDWLCDWLEKKEVKPVFNVRAAGPKHLRRYLCELRCRPIPYQGIGNSTSREESEINAAKDFIQYLLRQGQLKEDECPDLYGQVLEGGTYGSGGNSCIKSSETITGEVNRSQSISNGNNQAETWQLGNASVNFNQGLSGQNFANESGFSSKATGTGTNFNQTGVDQNWQAPNYNQWFEFTSKTNPEMFENQAGNEDFFQYMTFCYQNYQRAMPSASSNLNDFTHNSGQQDSYSAPAHKEDTKIATSNTAQKESYPSGEENSSASGYIPEENGNWTVEFGKPYLHNYLRAYKINADYEYRFDEPSQAFVCDMEFYAPHLGKNVSGKGYGPNKYLASKYCALNVVLNLYSMGAVGKFTGDLKVCTEEEKKKSEDGRSLMSNAANEQNIQKSSIVTDSAAAKKEIGITNASEGKCNWSLENSKQYLHNFIRVNCLDVDFKFTEERKTEFSCTLEFDAPFLKEKVSGKGFAPSKIMASKVCALIVMKKLFSQGVVGSFNGSYSVRPCEWKANTSVENRNLPAEYSDTAADKTPNQSASEPTPRLKEGDGNWTIKVARKFLQGFLSAYRIKASFIYQKDRRMGVEICEMKFYFADLKREICGKGYGVDRNIACMFCSLDIVLQLYSLGVIDEFNGSLKVGKAKNRKKMISEQEKDVSCSEKQNVIGLPEDYSPESFGNWTLENAKRYLKSYMSAYRLTGDYQVEKYKNTGGFISRIAFHSAVLNEDISAAGVGRSKLLSTKMCALNAILLLYKKGAIEAFTGSYVVKPPSAGNIPVRIAEVLKNKGISEADFTSESNSLLPNWMNFYSSRNNIKLHTDVEKITDVPFLVLCCHLRKIQYGKNPPEIVSLKGYGTSKSKAKSALYGVLIRHWVDIGRLDQSEVPDVRMTDQEDENAGPSPIVTDSKTDIDKDAHLHGNWTLANAGKVCNRLNVFLAHNKTTAEYKRTLVKLGKEVLPLCT